MFKANEDTFDETTKSYPRETTLQMVGVRLPPMFSEQELRPLAMFRRGSFLTDLEQAMTLEVRGILAMRYRARDEGDGRSRVSLLLRARTNMVREYFGGLFGTQHAKHRFATQSFAFSGGTCNE